MIQNHRWYRSVHFFTGSLILFFAAYFPWLPSLAQPSITNPDQSSYSTVQVMISPGLMNFGISSVSSPRIESQTTSSTASWEIGLAVQDLRGTGNGWEINMNLEHLTMTGPPRHTPINTGPDIFISPGYSYLGWWGESGNNPCSMRVEIIRGGEVGTATIIPELLGGPNCKDTTIDSQLPLVTKAMRTEIGKGRLFLDFSAGNYIAGSHYTIVFDMIDYHQCTLSPTPVIGTNQSSPMGIVASEAGKVRGLNLRSDMMTVIKASGATGMGTFEEKMTISCLVHENPLPGPYRGTINFSMY